MKKYVKYILLVGTLFIFGFIAVSVYKGNDINFDGAIYDFVSEYFISESRTPFVKVITWFGSTIGIILMCIISLFVIRNKKINISIVCCIVISTILNNVIKVVFARVRPDINPLVVETSYSFPSGHSMASMVFYGYLIYLIYHLISNKKIKWSLICLISILITLIGFSRIYLGVHYVSDVIGGFALGIVYLIIYIDIARKIIKKI